MKIICDFSVFYLDETLPKGSIVVECGNALLKNGYKLKILNTINFSKSMHYNPFSYVHSEKDILKLVTTLMTNTKGDGSGGDPFWEKSERLLLTALIAYLHYEAPKEEQNFSTLLEMLNTMQVSEDDEDFQNPVDLLFEDLAKRKPNSFAGRQYKLYKLAAGKTAKSILISCGARLAPFDIQELRDRTMYDELELDMLGDRKTALFLIMSDTDSTFNFLISMVYTQLFNLLCDKADDKYGGKLPVHVRCLIDECANIGQIKELGKQMKKLGMLVIQDQVWGRVTANRTAGKSTRYYADEFHLLLKEEQTAAYSVEIWKRFRKWGGIPTGLTQNVKDLLSSREVENIFENSDMIIMLNQAAGDRQILAKQLNISPHQLSYVTHSGEGEGLLFFGNVILPFVDRFPTDLELYRIMTTKLGEVSEGAQK